jgi:hypothetical protein
MAMPYHRILVAAAVLITAIGWSLPAVSLDKERSATVNRGEKKRIWIGGNYGRRCATAGPPIFVLTSEPKLGKVTAEKVDYTVPAGEPCQGTVQPGIAIWFEAGGQAGTDTFTYTLDFPHEVGNPVAAKGPQPVAGTITVK